MTNWQNSKVVHVLVKAIVSAILFWVKDRSSQSKGIQKKYKLYEFEIEKKQTDPFSNYKR